MKQIEHSADRPHYTEKEKKKKKREILIEDQKGMNKGRKDKKT